MITLSNFEVVKYNTIYLDYERRASAHETDPNSDEEYVAIHHEASSGIHGVRPLRAHREVNHWIIIE